MLPLLKLVTGEMIFCQMICFENSTSVRVDIPETYGSTCMFDMKITDLAGNSITFTGMDACKLHTLILNADGTYSAVE